MKGYILSLCRTAVGSYGGAFKDVAAVDLGAAVIKEAISRAGITPDMVDEVVLGNVLQANQGQNPARQAAVKAGIPVERPAMTINKVCGSGLRTVSLASQIIQAGDADCVVAGGMECMSKAPFALANMRWGARMNNVLSEDIMIKDGLWDAFNGYHMGMTAENVSEQFGVSREDQDELAYHSQMKAAKARETGRFKDEIVPFEVKKKKETVMITDDEFIRPDTTPEVLAKLRPAFKKDGGTVTAGNASGINDGAAIIIVASEKFVKEHNLKPMAEIVSYGSVGVDPSIMGVGPIPSIRQALDRAGMTIDDIDLFEVNEAFAAQAVAVKRELKIPDEKLNVNGGAIALGHPIGASGARIFVSLVYEMIKRDAKIGLASLCIGGGMGEALIIKRV